MTCYGNFARAPGAPSNLIPKPGGIPFGPELAEVFSRHAVTVDVLNPGSIAGSSHKPVLAFASGGFVLLNRKREFVTNFGAAGEAVSYTGVEELGRKVKYFLAHFKERQETGDAIRERIHARYQLRDVLARVLISAMKLPGATTPCPKPYRNSAKGIVLRNLLSEVQRTPTSGAGIAHTPHAVGITTSREAWSYAAILALPAELHTIREPFLAINMRVEVGRLGIATTHTDHWQPLAEQFVSPGNATVTLELPREGVTAIILRNTVDGVSRAVLYEAALCDRM